MIFRNKDICCLRSLKFLFFRFSCRSNFLGKIFMNTRLPGWAFNLAALQRRYLFNHHFVKKHEDIQVKLRTAMFVRGAFILFIPVLKVQVEAIQTTEQYLEIGIQWTDIVLKIWVILILRRSNNRRTITWNPYIQIV